MSLSLVLMVSVASIASYAAPQNDYRSTKSLYGHHTGYNPPHQSYKPCPHGLSRRADGKCVVPKVSKDVYLFNAPSFKRIYTPPKHFPHPKVHYNYVFVRTPDAGIGHRPLVVPPAKQKTIIYLLNEKPSALAQQLIEVPSKPSQPEVYYVTYNDGDDPLLPGGIKLQTALNHATNGGHIGTGNVFGNDGGVHGFGNDGGVHGLTSNYNSAHNDGGVHGLTSNYNSAHDSLVHEAQLESSLHKSSFDGSSIYGGRSIYDTVNSIGLSHEGSLGFGVHDTGYSVDFDGDLISQGFNGNFGKTYTNKFDESFGNHFDGNFGQKFIRSTGGNTGFDKFSSGKYSDSQFRGDSKTLVGDITKRETSSKYRE